MEPLVLPLQIVAHRGAPEQAPENTIPSFERAIELGADAVELDVRLTSDRVPVVHHYIYLEQATDACGPLFERTFAELRDVKVRSRIPNAGAEYRIPSLEQVLATMGGRIGLEIEIKGPEPESAEIVGTVLSRFRHPWASIEVTSYEPALLLEVSERCPGVATDLLFPRSEDWMGPDVVAYLAGHRARLAHARAVHLNPGQLSQGIVSAVRRQGPEVHAWGVNDQQAMRTAVELRVPRICTDRLQLALQFREGLASRLCSAIRP
jgi:glycerophosphoryl diester phosphodiesterase